MPGERERLAETSPGLPSLLTCPPVILLTSWSWEPASPASTHCTSCARKACPVRVFETAPDVGGTWYHNRYPGARCDVESVDYCYSFSDELQQEWTWTEKYATQAEILSYLQRVADKLDLRNDITFNTRVTSATLDEETLRWTVATDNGEVVQARFCIMATGPLSAALTPDFKGLDTFKGEVYHTAYWPHEGVDFTGKRVAVVGTGSSGVQSIPIIAEQAEQLFCVPAHPELQRARRKPATDRRGDGRGQGELRRAAPVVVAQRRGIAPHHAPEADHGSVTRGAARRLRKTLGAWRSAVLENLRRPDDRPSRQRGGAQVLRGEGPCGHRRPDVAELLIPDDHPIGTKRICTDTNYFTTFNRPNVKLVSVRKTPVESIDETGIDTSDSHFSVDVIVLATGFDAMTGALGEDRHRRPGR